MRVLRAGKQLVEDRSGRIREGCLGAAPGGLPCSPTPGLRHTEWPGRTQLLRRGPLTWYLDGAHTTSSMQACVRWFRQALHHCERPDR